VKEEPACKLVRRENYPEAAAGEIANRYATFADTFEKARAAGNALAS
jgi:hypothetical protein